MKKFAFVLALSMVFAGAALAEITVYQPGPGGNEQGADHSIIWSDPPDLEGNVGSSEIIPAYALESELANDFIVEVETTVCLARWWGGYWNGTGPALQAMTATFYTDGGCVPDAQIVQYYVEGNAGETEVVYQRYVYELAVDVLVAPNLYWFSAQGTHDFPPQWGRVAAVAYQACDTMFRSVYFSYPDWIPFHDVIGSDYESSQEFEDDCVPVATETSNWGAIKGLYR